MRIGRRHYCLWIRGEIERCSEWRRVVVFIGGSNAISDETVLERAKDGGQLGLRVLLGFLEEPKENLVMPFRW